jgi:hypothetical protein
VHCKGKCVADQVLPAKKVADVSRRRWVTEGVSRYHDAGKHVGDLVRRSRADTKQQQYTHQKSNTH